MKENQSVKPLIDMDAQVVMFDVRNHTPLRLDMTKLHRDIITRAAYVGMAQVRIVDAAAVSRQRKDGTIRTASEMDAEKYNRMAALIAHYESGSADWNVKGAAREDNSALILKAVARVRGIDATAALNLCTKFADSAHEGDLKAALAHIAKDGKYAKAMLEIKAESIVAVVDADDALDELAAQQ